MENFIFIIVASFVLGMSCIPSRQRRQFDWSNNFDDFDNDRNNQQDPNNNLNDDRTALNRQLMGASTSAPITLSTGITTTRASASFTRCMNSCLTTQQYNPVCGTDGNTYSNQGRLMCAATCGASVQLLRGGTCQPL